MTTQPGEGQRSRPGDGDSVSIEASWAAFRATLPEALAALLPEDRPAVSADVLDLPSGARVTVPELLAALRDQVALQSLGGPLVLHAEGAQVGYVAYAWREVVYRQTRAVVALFNANLSDQAQPNARVALEHAVILQAAARAHMAGTDLDFLAAVNWGQEEHARRAIKRLVKWDQGMGGQNASLITAAAEHQKANAALPKPFTSAQPSALFEQLPAGGGGFHTVWSSLSASLHAGFVSAMPYLPADGPGGLGSVPVRWADALVALVWSCWASDDALDQLTAVAPIAGRHVPAMRSVGLAPDAEPRHRGAMDRVDGKGPSRRRPNTSTTGTVPR
jgi:hypothetical protein